VTLLALGGCQTYRSSFLSRVPTEGLSTAKRYLGSTESLEPDVGSGTDTRGAPLIFIITAVALVPQIAEAIVRVYRDYRYGGVIIGVGDNGVLNISTDQRIPASTVVVQAKDGVKIYERKNPEADDLKGPLGSLLTSTKR
jgi:hypothetical protein